MSTSKHYVTGGIMESQIYISDDGGLESQPLSWDGVPLFSPSTVREGLFDASAFEQMPGQLVISSCENSIAAHSRLLDIMDRAARERRS